MLVGQTEPLLLIKNENSPLKTVVSSGSSGLWNGPRLRARRDGQFGAELIARTANITRSVSIRMNVMTEILLCLWSSGLDPGHAAHPQHGIDLAGDFLVEARPAGAGLSASSLPGHCGSAAKSFSM